MLPQGLDVLLHILQQGGQGRPLMVRGNVPARPAPEPLDSLSVGIVGRRIHDPQGVLQRGPHLAHQLRARGRMGAQVIHDHDRQTSLGA